MYLSLGLAYLGLGIRDLRCGIGGKMRAKHQALIQNHQLVIVSPIGDLQF